MEQTTINETLTEWTAVDSLFNGNDHQAYALWSRT